MRQYRLEAKIVRFARRMAGVGFQRIVAATRFLDLRRVRSFLLGAMFFAAPDRARLTERSTEEAAAEGLYRIGRLGASIARNGISYAA